MDCKLTLLAFFLCFVGIFANPILQDVESNNIDDDEDLIDLSHLDGRAFGDPDEEVGKMLQEAISESTDLNPEELGSYFEGDILMPKVEGRSALADKSKRWPGGVVPYIIEGGFSAAQRAVIESAIAEYHAKTCIRFVPRSSQADYIIFKGDDSGCWSSVGRVGGAQTINLQKSGCLAKKGTCLHEIAHAMGVFHEQNRADRDNHVQIRFENIQTGLEANFEKASPGTTNTYGVPYDYGSVMHYSANAFSKNGRPTIVAMQGGSSKMGQRDSFSSADIQRIRLMYECNGSGGSNMGGGSAKPPGKPIGTNKPRPTTSTGGSGTKPIKPIKGVRPIKPIRPAGYASNNGGAGGLFNNFLGGAQNAASQFMNGIGSNFQSLGSNLMGAIGFDEKETGRSDS